MPRMPHNRLGDIPEPSGPLLHDRNYSVRSYREGEQTLRIRGEVHDVKPPGLYVADDPEPMSVHLMVVDLVIAYPALEIVEAEVLMEVTPHSGCTTIEPAYDKLIGLSIARGFSRQVRELFGGPRGCTHVGALLNAMAPVAIQSMWSMHIFAAREGTAVSIGPDDEVLSEEEQRIRRMSTNKNTCHVWDEDGELWDRAIAGDELEIPLWAADRLVEMGRDPAEWRTSSPFDGSDESS